MFEALMFEINNLIEKKQESRKKNLLLKEFSNSQKKNSLIPNNFLSRPSFFSKEQYWEKPGIKFGFSGHHVRPIFWPLLLEVFLGRRSFIESFF